MGCFLLELFSRHQVKRICAERAVWQIMTLAKYKLVRKEIQNAQLPVHYRLGSKNIGLARTAIPDI